MNLYDITVPVFIKMLGGLKTVLAKAGEHAAGNDVDLLNDKLAPDMFPFVKQVQVATDNAKGAAARLAGVEIPKMDDTESTVAELQARIDKTIEFLKTFKPEQFADAAERQVTLSYFPGKYFKGYDYALEYALPNFLFHVTTAYAIARKRGVEVGKADFINGLSLQDA